MLSFNKITMEDKDLFYNYLRKYKPTISELTFTNLFMWKSYYGIYYTEYENMLVIKADMPLKNEDSFFFFPIGGEESGMDKLGELLEKMYESSVSNNQGFNFKRTTEIQAQLIRQVFPKASIMLDRNNSDYVYKAEDLVFLKGKKYDGKRNHINRFKKEYTFEYYSYDSNNFVDDGFRQDCTNIMEEWCRRRNCECHRSLYCEKVANILLIDNFEKLNLKCGLIKVNGKAEAFTTGEMLNDDTAVVHIEKANSDIHGLFTLINQQFCQHEWMNAQYINREQDLGEEGLRKAKLSYNPVRLIDKYMVNVEK